MQIYAFSIFFPRKMKKKLLWGVRNSTFRFPIYMNGVCNNDHRFAL